MSEPRPAYPEPVPDADNRALLEGWREGRLFLQHCGGCGRSVFYPRPMCPFCWSTNLVWRKSEGRGEIVSFSLIHRPNHPSFVDEVPIVLAEVRLAEGALLLARVLSQAPRTGLKISLLPLPEARRYPLPIFRPAVE